MLLRLVVGEIVDRDVHRLDVPRRVGALHHHDAIGLGEREPLDERAVDDAEHHGREADPDAEREDGDDRQPRALGEGAGRVAEVTEGGVHGRVE